MVRTDASASLLLQPSDAFIYERNVLTGVLHLDPLVAASFPAFACSSVNSSGWPAQFVRGLAQCSTRATLSSVLSRDRRTGPHALARKKLLFPCRMRTQPMTFSFQEPTRFWYSIELDPGIFKVLGPPRLNNVWDESAVSWLMEKFFSSGAARLRWRSAVGDLERSRDVTDYDVARDNIGHLAKRTNTPHRIALISGGKEDRIAGLRESAHVSGRDPLGPNDCALSVLAKVHQLHALDVFNWF